MLTDNGACYRSKAFARTIRRLNLRHYRTRPYTPRTNGTWYRHSHWLWHRRWYLSISDSPIACLAAHNRNPRDGRL
ncbi:hypothetical protein BVV20_00850 [Xanthomonas oryzae pv. oryzae]|nr:hypothetical protein BVV20_00850 [Xanthomonas oryzae pv. oryzae]